MPGFRRAGESALHERDHRGGDHPIPFRTRQLSPPSPKVLQRQAAGGQGVALMQGASAFPGPYGPLFFVVPFCGMSPCGLLQVSVHSSVFEFLKEAPPCFLVHSLYCMLRIVSYELLSYGETDTPFTLCVFFLARALLSFRYY